MTKPLRVIQNYLIISSPFVLACMVWGSFSSQKNIFLTNSILLKITWEILSWNLMIWFGALIVFLISLALAPSVREATLKRLANIKDRDEREHYITGEASRSAYIASLSMMILLLFLSIFTLKIYRVPESEAINGKRSNVSIGLQFDLIDKPKTEIGPTGEVIFESKDIPLSKTAIILLLIAWQLIAFNLKARKESFVTE